MKRSPAPPTPWSPLTTNSAASASASSDSTRRCMREVSASRGRWTPGRSVSTSWNRSGTVTTPRIARRVVCGLSETIATFWPTIALTSVDLPTLGRPASATKPERVPITASPQPAHDLGLKSEHLALVGLVIHAGQVQHTVHDRLDQIRRVLGADEDVAQFALAQRVHLILVDRKGQHVGRTVLRPPDLVELGDPLGADELDGHVAFLDPRRGGRVGDRLLHANPGKRATDHFDVQQAQAVLRRWSALAGRRLLACPASCWSYASTIRWTSLWRTTSSPPKRTNSMPSTHSRMSPITTSPERWVFSRSSCVMSPVTTIFELKPSRVRNIFICSGVVFCASSRMMNESFSERPRMKASGATSITPRSRCWLTRSGSSIA